MSRPKLYVVASLPQHVRAFKQTNQLNDYEAINLDLSRVRGLRPRVVFVLEPAIERRDYAQLITKIREIKCCTTIVYTAWDRPLTKEIRSILYET